VRDAAGKVVGCDAELTQDVLPYGEALWAAGGPMFGPSGRGPGGQAGALYVMCRPQARTQRQCRTGSVAHRSFAQHRDSEGLTCNRLCGGVGGRL
jgi:hypothetical protein